MSEMVHYKGKLTKLDKLLNETLEQQCKRMLETMEGCKNWKSDGSNTFYSTLFIYECRKQYIIHNGALYQVERKAITDDEILQMTPTKDGFVFELKYYDGGCGFTEAIRHAFDSMEKEG